MAQFPLPDIYPKSPDPYLEVLGRNKSRASLARLAHIRPLISAINALYTMIVGGTTIINVGKTIYVDSVYGNDSTALRQRLDKPFQTLFAAKSAALQGDLIYIRNGSYTVFGNLIKVNPATNLSMVNYYAEEGVELNCFGNPFDASTSALTGFTNTFSFTGYAKVLFCSGNIVRVQSLLQFSTLYLEFDNVVCNNISNGVIILSGLAYFNVRRDYTCAGRAFSMRLTGNVVANIGGTVTTTFANVFNGCFWVSGTAWTGTAYIKAKTFALSTTVVVGGNWQHIYLDNLIGGKLHVELEYLTDTSTNTQAIVQVGNTAFVDTAQTTVIIDIKEINLNRRALWQVNGAGATNFANLFVNGDTATCLNIAGASVGAIKGVLTVNYHQVFVSNTMVVTGTGVLALSNTLVDSSAFGGITPITVTAGKLSLMSSTLVSDGIAPSVSNPGGITLSEGSKANVAAIGIGINGNLYINPLYID